MNQLNWYENIWKSGNHICGRGREGTYQWGLVRFVLSHGRPWQLQQHGLWHVVEAVLWKYTKLINIATVITTPTKQNKTRREKKLMLNSQQGNGNKKIEGDEKWVLAETVYQEVVELLPLMGWEGVAVVVLLRRVGAEEVMGLRQLRVDQRQLIDRRGHTETRYMSCK